METFTLILGLIAASLTTFAYLPQLIKAIRTRNIRDLSLPMIIMLEAGLITWMIYGLLVCSVPIITANIISIVFITIILYIKVKYK